jgi:hypothetical protein
MRNIGIDIDLNMKRTVDDALARAVAIGGLTAVALIHMLELPDAFDAVGYLGGLFIAAIVAALALAATLSRTTDNRAWAAAGALPALLLLCYVISRSVGLPAFTEDTGEWSEPLGLASMVVESLLIFVTAAVLATRGYPARLTAGRRERRAEGHGGALARG